MLKFLLFAFLFIWLLSMIFECKLNSGDDGFVCESHSKIAKIVLSVSGIGGGIGSGSGSAGRKQKTTLTKKQQHEENKKVKLRALKEAREDLRKALEEVEKTLEKETKEG